MVFYEDNPRIDCKVKFDFNGQKIGLLSENKRDSHSPFVHEEKLRFKFFPGPDTSAVGIRDLPFTIAETGNKYIEGNYWTALAGEKKGIAFFNKGNMGSIHEKDGSFSIPLAYAMYYIWGTRMLYGPYEYEFAIMPFSGKWQNANLQKLSLEYSFGIPTIEIKPSGNKFGDVVTSFAFSADDDIILTALYPKNNKVNARFFKAGEADKISSVRFSKTFIETDFDGNSIRKAPVKTDFHPWEIKTFIIKSIQP